MMDLSKASKKSLLAAALAKSRKAGTHWTQTPEGREVRSRDQSKSRKAELRIVASKEVTHTPTSNGTHPSQDHENQIAYVFGRIESQLEIYSGVTGVPFPLLAQRISELLRSKEGGKVSRSAHRLSSVR
jgi:hypothetical protein